MFNAPSSLRIMPVFRTGEDGALPSERSCPPTETIERIWPYLPAFGITRLARQTDLDRVGIACWAAFRPNSKSLASAQCK
jgi:ribosomal protein S12 methylthiotransferase accessory factor